MSYYEIKPKYDRFGNKLQNGKYDKFWTILKLIIIAILVYIFCIKGIQVDNTRYWIKPL